MVREGDRELNYTSNLANPHDVDYKKLVEKFEHGISDSYAKTSLGNSFVSADVNEIVRPSDFIKARQILCGRLNFKPRHWKGHLSC